MQLNSFAIEFFFNKELLAIKVLHNFFRVYPSGELRSQRVEQAE